MRDYLALAISGLENKELMSLVSLFLFLSSEKQFGEVPGGNLRFMFEWTKEKLFHNLETLVQRNIFKYSTTVPENCCYVMAGKNCYVFNSSYSSWQPTSTSIFYKVSKLLGWRFNEQSYKSTLLSLDLRQPFRKTVSDEKGLTVYEIYDLFCSWHSKIFRQEYSTTNSQRDFLTIKKLMCEMHYLNYSDSQIRNFIEWCFLQKAKDFKGAFMVGFLPLCLKDYKLGVNISKIPQNYEKDENGNLRLKS